MVSNLDVWRAANLLIREHGADADLEAARLAGLMLGRASGAALWIWLGFCRLSRRRPDLAITPAARGDHAAYIASCGTMVG
jgi:hypothetical protein